MSTTSLTKPGRAIIPGALIIRYLVGKMDVVRYLPKLVNGVLRFNASGELEANDTLPVKSPSTIYTADGAIALTSGIHKVSKTSAAAMTVAAPTAAQDGTRMTISAGTNFAHVITFTGSTLLDGTTGANLTVTMTAFIGSAITVVAVGTKWHLKSSSNVTSITV